MIWTDGAQLYGRMCMNGGTALWPAPTKKSEAPFGAPLRRLGLVLRGPSLVLGECLAAFSRHGRLDDPRRVLGLGVPRVDLAQMIAQDLGVDANLRRKLLGRIGLFRGCHVRFTSFGFRIQYLHCINHSDLVRHTRNDLLTLYKTYGRQISHTWTMPSSVVAAPSDDAQLSGLRGADIWPGALEQGALAAPCEVEVEGKAGNDRPHRKYVCPYEHSFILSWYGERTVWYAPHSFVLGRGDVLRECLAGSGRDVCGDDPRLVLRFDRARMVLAQIVAKYLRIDADFGGEFLRRVCLGVRHFFPFVRSIVHSIDRYSVPDAYAFVCKCSFDRSIVRPSNRSIVQAFVRIRGNVRSDGNVRCVARADNTRRTPADARRRNRRWTIFARSEARRTLDFQC